MENMAGLIISIITLILLIIVIVIIICSKRSNNQSSSKNNFCTPQCCGVPNNAGKTCTWTDGGKKVGTGICVYGYCTSHW